MTSNHRFELGVLVGILMTSAVIATLRAFGLWAAIVVAALIGLGGFLAHQHTSTMTDEPLSAYVCRTWTPRSSIERADKATAIACIQALEANYDAAMAAIRLATAVNEETLAELRGVREED
jgi:hypothetical protein